MACKLEYFARTTQNDWYNDPNCGCIYFAREWDTTVSDWFNISIVIRKDKGMTKKPV